MRCINWTQKFHCLKFFLKKHLLPSSLLEKTFFFFFLAVDSYCECLTAGGGSVLLQKLLFYFAVLKIWVKPKAAWNADITTVHSKKKSSNPEVFYVESLKRVAS